MTWSNLVRLWLTFLWGLPPYECIKSFGNDAKALGQESGTLQEVFFFFTNEINFIRSILKLDATNPSHGYRTFTTILNAFLVLGTETH